MSKRSVYLNQIHRPHEILTNSKQNFIFYAILTLYSIIQCKQGPKIFQMMKTLALRYRVDLADLVQVFVLYPWWFPGPGRLLSTDVAQCDPVLMPSCSFAPSVTSISRSPRAVPRHSRAPHGTVRQDEWQCPPCWIYKRSGTARHRSLPHSGFRTAAKVHPSWLPTEQAPDTDG